MAGNSWYGTKIARVQMPDGRIARLEVPQNTTPEQAQQIALRHVPAQQGSQQQGGKDTRPESWTHGVADSWRLANANVARLSQFTPFAPRAGGGAEADMREQGRQQYNAAAPTRPSWWGQTVGGVAATLPTAVVPNPLLQGGLSGLILSNNLKDPKTAAIDAGLGMAGGKLGQLAGEYVVSPVVRRIANAAPVRSLVDGASRLVRGRPAPAPPRLTMPEKVESG